MLEWLEYIDRDFFLFFNGFHNSFFDNLMPWLSGNILWLPFYGWLIYTLFKKFTTKKFVWSLVAIILCVALTDLISFNVLKETIQRYRPCHNLEISNLIHVVGNCGGLHSFVSSHASNVFGIAMLLSFLIKDKSTSFQLFTWATIVGYSRIYLGVHYPADVLGGGVLGVAVGFIVYRGFVKFAPNE
ncbi:MAG: phosphatase PAP2 family protein [Flavobacteriales bacterium]|nr:phosphatase PAP2 family protein [Flavobacteriales bacterium]